MRGDGAAMDGNWRPAQDGGNPGMESPDWRNQLSQESRSRIVNKILDTLKKKLPIFEPDGLVKLQKVAIRFEEKIYTLATSQTDYLRRISVKMLAMETESQTSVANSFGVGGQNPSDAASNAMESQMRSQGRQQLHMTMFNPTQKSIPSAAVQNTVSLSATMPVMTGLTQTGITDVAQNASLPPSLGGIAQNSNSNSLVGQGVQPNVFANTQRQQQLQGSQQQSQNPQQQYNMHQQQQLRNQLLKHKIQQQQQQQQQGNMQSSMLYTHLQQQQQSSLLQSNQLQGSQQSLKQITSGHPSSQALQQLSPSMMQTVPQSGLQQSQQVPSVLHQHQQSLMRPQQQPQQSSMHQQQQQSQLIRQEPNAHGPQQLLGQQQIGFQEMQQQQQQRLLSSLANLSNKQQSQQPSMLGQQSNFSTLSQQQQLSVQNNVAGGQQQHQLIHQGTLSNIQPHQNSMHMMQQAKVVASQQQSNQRTSSTGLPSQGQQQSQSLAHQQQFTSQLQSQSAQLSQHLTLQQQQPQVNSILLQQRMQAPSNLLQAQSTIEQQKQQKPHPFQVQRGLPEASSASVDSTAQTGHDAVDWQEEVYQKLKSMKEMYFMDISELHNRLSVRYQQHDGLTQGKQSEQVEKIKMFRALLERIMHFLNLPKSGIQPSFKEKIAAYEKQIVSVLNTHRIKKPTPLLQQGQQPNSPAVASLSSMPQQPTVQMSQLQQHDSLVNQMQPMSMQSSTTSSMSMPLTTNMGVPHAQQSILNSLPPQSQSPQISQHPSPQIDRQSLHTNISKTGTPLQSANSPFAPSPSTPFTAPSLIPGEQEKPTCWISSISNAGNVGSQQVGPTLSEANTLAMCTPGMSASPLLAEFTGADGNQGNATVAGKASTTSMSMPISKNVGVTHAQQSLLNSPQPAQNLDQGHGNAMACSQQNVMASLQQNSVNGTQQGGVDTLQRGVNLLQLNMNAVLSNTNILRQQHLKKQQLMKKQQLKQQFPCSGFDGTAGLDSDFAQEQGAIADQRMMSAVFLSIMSIIIVCSVLGFLNVYY